MCSVTSNNLKTAVIADPKTTLVEANSDDLLDDSSEVSCCCLAFLQASDMLLMSLHVFLMHVGFIINFKSECHHAMHLDL